ncbi:type 1 glutamine amidotransferase [Algoriphagus boseongensis]|uniref:Type 1 glutamine amidotransferase n=1 Tax=Algoriphagus boseongensis TaxID=1442587 RepID=A0A4R6T3C2_9BACT|nr:ThuA domain-containing protein [Algoriphagus boseongensis]TDQ15051.1 type 1 glutamine amidotransferase [Algoriphagus boseongensis]
MSQNQFKSLILFIFLLGFASQACAQNGVTFLQFEGGSGPGKGKHIVLVAGDDEYRSEESMPMLGKILSERYGFKTTVLFPIHPETGDIVPNYQNNIPGLEHLETADLMIMLIRFRELPDEQSKHIENFLKVGKPIIGLRTSTHAFSYQKNLESPFAKWHWMSKAEGWERGFGQRIFGETWVNHHGNHGKEGTRALPDGVDQLNGHPILRGVKDIWGPSDVYGIKHLPAEANVLLFGQSTAGMTADSPMMYEKSVMPIAWTKPYQIEGGSPGMAFASTMGASLDFQSADLRRLVINASFWLLGMPEAITPDMNVDYVGSFEPTMFGFDTFRKGMRVSDFK